MNFKSSDGIYATERRLIGHIDSINAILSEYDEKKSGFVQAPHFKLGNLFSHTSVDFKIYFSRNGMPWLLS